MKTIKTIKTLVTVAVLAAALTAQASIETKTWPASEEAGQFVQDTPMATQRGCYISDEEALRVKKSGGFISPTFTEWMMDGIWPEDITPQQCADMMTTT